MLNVIRIKQEQPDLINDAFYHWLSFSRIKDYIDSYETLSNYVNPQVRDWFNKIQSDQEWLKYKAYNEVVSPRHQIYGVYKNERLYILEEWYLSTAAAQVLNVSIEELGMMTPDFYIETLRQSGYLVDTLAHWCGEAGIMGEYEWNSNRFPSLLDATDYVLNFNYSKANRSAVIKHLTKNVDKRVYGACLHKTLIDKPTQKFAGINTLVPQN